MKQTLSLDGLLTVLEKTLMQYPTQSAAARALGLSKQYLNDVCARRRDPGPKVAAALGYVAEIKFRRSDE